MASKHKPHIIRTIAEKLNLSYADVQFAINAYDKDIVDLVAMPIGTVVYIEKIGILKFRVPSEYKYLHNHCEKAMLYKNIYEGKIDHPEIKIRTKDFAFRLISFHLNKFIYLTLLVLDHVYSVCPNKKRQLFPEYLDDLRTDLFRLEEFFGIQISESSIKVHSPAQEIRMQLLREKGLLGKFKNRQPPYDDRSLQLLRVRTYGKNGVPKLQVSSK